MTIAEIKKQLLENLEQEGHWLICDCDIGEKGGCQMKKILPLVMELFSRLETAVREEWLEKYGDLTKQFDELQKSREPVREEVVKMAEGMKRRFRCAACDGAKCEHTHCCIVLSSLKHSLEEIKRSSQSFGTD